MSDDFDDYQDLPPVDEEADDFKNFDPAQYLAKRQRSSSSRDFAADDYDAEVLAPRGRASRRGSRRRRADSVDDAGDGEMGAEGIPVGLSAGILGMLIRPENSRLISELFGSAAPIVRSVLPAVGCVLLALCALVCGAGYIVITTLTKR